MLWQNYFAKKQKKNDDKSGKKIMLWQKYYLQSKNIFAKAKKLSLNVKVQ